MDLPSNPFVELRPTQGFLAASRRVETARLGNCHRIVYVELLLTGLFGKDRLLAVSDEFGLVTTAFFRQLFYASEAPGGFAGADGCLSSRFLLLLLEQVDFIHHLETHPPVFSVAVPLPLPFVERELLS